MVMGSTFPECITPFPEGVTLHCKAGLHGLSQAVLGPPRVRTGAEGTPVEGAGREWSLQEWKLLWVRQGEGE